VNVLEQLVETESGKDKARYLVAIANILNYELQSPVEAVELYDQALDEDPDDRRSFERIERILSSQQDWRELARAYRHMIKRLGASPPADKRAYLLALWRGLAEISRVRQADLAAAAAALEVCVSLAPEDNKQREALVEVYEAQGAGGFAGAVKLREQLLAAASDAEGAAQQIRALAGLYGEHQRYDGAFCACAALCALMKANTQEKAFYAQHALPGVPLAKAGLSEGRDDFAGQGRASLGARHQPSGRSDQGQFVGVADFGLRQPTHRRVPSRRLRSTDRAGRDRPGDPAGGQAGASGLCAWRRTGNRPDRS
jgi:hypothetical protein